MAAGFRLRRGPLPKLLGSAGDFADTRNYLKATISEGVVMSTGRQLLEQFAARQKPDAYRQEHWQGSFSEVIVYRP